MNSVAADAPIWCLYHHDCIDGLAAAAVVQRRFPQAQLVSWNYSHGLPEIPLAHRCYVVDLVPPVSFMQQLAESNEVHWYDHHQSAVAMQADLGFGIIEQDECAATLTWKQLFPKEELPAILRHVRAKDLWQWDEPNSKAIAAALGEEMSESVLPQIWSWDLASLITQGEVILDRIRQRCKRIAGRGLPCFDAYGRMGTTALAINNGDIVSDVGEFVYTPKHLGGLGYDLSICFWMRHDGRWVHSLRSTTIDCAAIADARGGGGHRQAAAYTSDAPFPLSDDFLG